MSLANHTLGWCWQCTEKPPTRLPVCSIGLHGNRYPFASSRAYFYSLTCIPSRLVRLVGCTSSAEVLPAPCPTVLCTSTSGRSGGNARLRPCQRLLPRARTNCWYRVAAPRAAQYMPAVVDTEPGQCCLSGHVVLGTVISAFQASRRPGVQASRQRRSGTGEACAKSALYSRQHRWRNLQLHAQPLSANSCRSIAFHFFSI